MTDPFKPLDDFLPRHLGPRDHELPGMLQAVGFDSLDDLMAATVPQAIRMRGSLQGPIGPALSESEALADLKEKVSENIPHRSYIGMGYYSTIVPPVIQRNVLENPGWYTQYTPYQAEISQGRLEALLNFQTMCSELTGLDIANASLLDEGTAAAEAMTLCLRSAKKRKGQRFLVDQNLNPQTIEVVCTRATPLGIEIELGNPEEFAFDDTIFGVLLAYPDTTSTLRDLEAVASAAHEAGALVSVVTDLLSLCLLKPPGEWGADVAVGSSQRFGVPMGFGGPHAAFFATRSAYQRRMPGRLIGVSQDANGKPALRMALQTREQHIRRDRATSNICTSQVLLAVMASMYAVYHGAEGLKAIAQRVHRLAQGLASTLSALGWTVVDGHRFDTVVVEAGDRSQALRQALAAARINLRELDDGRFAISLDEAVTEAELIELIGCFGGEAQDLHRGVAEGGSNIPAPLQRSTPPLQHGVFERYHAEHEMLRYLTLLQSRDLSLTASMIPLGSCTMKLNATAEMLPVTWPELAGVHPFAPADQTRGYQLMIEELEAMLAEVTGMAAVSLQPNAGSQGEYAGMLAIAAYHQARGDSARNVCLIPSSAHGTNPASAVLAGLEVAVVACDDLGNVDLEDLKTQAARHADRLAAIMVTYPSTHGVFEAGIVELCEIVHRHGGQVYMDGANMNAQVGLCRPGDFGVDVMHLNLHKTFAIPHGGGGPGVGPIAVAPHLAPYLPGHSVRPVPGADTVGAVSAAPWGSAGVLCISWMYMKMLGVRGLKRSTEIAILNANYLKAKLQDHYPVLYSGPQGTVAHEFILDLRPLKKTCGVEVADLAKRLMDYGFHAPTMAFPVAGTLMIEPTESESLQELDRLVEALLGIREEIAALERGHVAHEDSVLAHAPHSAEALCKTGWDRPYSREEAAFPTAHTRAQKFWPSVGRIDEAYGDRNLMCSCPPLEAYAVA